MAAITVTLPLGAGLRLAAVALCIIGVKRLSGKQKF